MRKTYILDLSDADRAQLRDRISRGRSSARAILKARILLKADQGPKANWLCWPGSA